MPGVYAGQASTSASIQDRPGLPLAGACCALLLREPITASQAAGFALLLNTLADPTGCAWFPWSPPQRGQGLRLRAHPAARPDPAHHLPPLKILVGAGIFTRDKRGVRACHALVPAALNALSAVLSMASQDPRPACPGS